MDVATDHLRCHLGQPFAVIHERQVVPDLSVSKIMPIADGLHLGKESTKFAFGWTSLDPDPILDPNPDPTFDRP